MYDVALLCMLVLLVLLVLLFMLLVLPLLLERWPSFFDFFDCFSSSEEDSDSDSEDTNLRLAESLEGDPSDFFLASMRGESVTARLNEVDKWSGEAGGAKLCCMTGVFAVLVAF